MPCVASLYWLDGGCQGAAATSCSVSTPGIAFGNYNVFATTAVTSTATLTVSCTLSGALLATVNYTVSMSTGSSNTFVQRQMQGGGYTLGYNLYTSNTYSNVWGDGTGSTSTVSGSMTLYFFAPTGSATLTAYGQIPAQQDAGVSSAYTDNIIVTVSY